jgi:ATP-dependent Lon protease
MSENTKIKSLTTQINDKSQEKNEVIALVEKKVKIFYDIIQKTILNVQKNKILDILGVSDVNACINTLNGLNEKIRDILQQNKPVTTEELISNLQTINNELSGLLKTYGTDSLEDLLSICFGNNNCIINNQEEVLKYELLKKYFHPTSYKVINKKEDTVKKSMNFADEFITDKTKNLDCCDMILTTKHFHNKVYGMKLYIYNSSFKKNLLIYGIVDDVLIDFMDNIYINGKMGKIKEHLPKDEEFNDDVFGRFLISLTLKDFLIYNHTDIYNKFIGYLSQHKILKHKTLTQIVKEFISSDLFTKRTIIIQLLINSDNYENKYMAYLLYDLLSNDVNGNVDTQEQTILFDSFPWPIKQYFRDAMKKTIQYTNDLSNFDINKIPLEQQICLLKANDSVKEKAMVKLKEVKAKSEDSGSKARQYLDGLLKIPFSVYKKEPILNIMNDTRLQFKDLITNDKLFDNSKFNIPVKENYTSIEVINYLKKISGEPGDDELIKTIKIIKSNIAKGDKTILIKIIKSINCIIIEKMKDANLEEINYAGKNKSFMRVELLKFIDFCFNDGESKYLHLITEIFDINIKQDNINLKTIKKINGNFQEITNYISNIKEVLDSSVHGHNEAKKQIERIIGQWINGEQDGYCFGFEGPPGIGKTSLAKRGLSNCLKDNNGDSRPFAMIQMGGDSNGSTLHGFNYTYVGSTWGNIVQILIDKKCMNPIIFIDELDKISRSEQGREIIGILTHLLDSTQNDCFQDKYFAGIDLDLSKALFILSYNDPESVDKILLDRIHRIKFNNLSLEDKLTISKLHILPEVYKKMGLEETIVLDDDTIKYIIEEYTSEPGVRKLKEVLFELVGEINLDILKNNTMQLELPIKIKKEDLKIKYFKNKQEVKDKKIQTANLVGIINGLWANAMGKGGVIPIQSKMFPCEKFLDLKLTGMQGDVMKESMNVALTLAWNLTEEKTQNILSDKYNSDGTKYGVHIHCPEGAVPKDGPSAGTAITTVIYSLLNNRKIKHQIAITGEISLDGFVTEIGGLDLKFLGGIKAGVKEFLFPLENEKDFDKFIEKYKNSEIIEGIIFHKVNHINDVFELVFESDIIN